MRNMTEIQHNSIRQRMMPYYKAYGQWIIALLILLSVVAIVVLYHQDQNLLQQCQSGDQMACKQYEKNHRQDFGKLE